MRGLLEPWHIIIIVALIFLLFGAKRLPDASRSLGRSMKIFKAEVKDLRDDDDQPELAEKSAASPSGTERAGAQAREAELRAAEQRVEELRAANDARDAEGVHRDTVVAESGAVREHDRV